MKFESYKEKIPDFARDARLNLALVLSEEGAPGLSRREIALSALAASLAANDEELSAALSELFASELQDQDLTAVKTAISIMSMTNVYYKFLTLLGDPEVQGLRANLRMQGLAKPPIAKREFEMASFVVSIWNGCESCIKAHAHELKNLGVTAQGLQSLARITAVIKSASVSKGL